MIFVVMAAGTLRDHYPLSRSLGLMTAHPLLTRRMLLKDMGRAGLAVVFLGVPACSEEPTEEATPTDEVETTSASRQSSSTSTTTTGSTSTTGGAAGHQWQRVNLGFVSAYILYRNGEAAVVDTGVEGSEGPIETGLSEVGVGWDSVGHLIVTHKHPDHQGSVEAVLDASAALWYAGANDVGLINAQSEGSVVGDGDSVFGLEVIETPGHTPGHISVLDPVAGILVAGDALNGADGGVVGPNPRFSDDMEAANASAVKLAGFDYEVALFGHGEPVLEGASGLVAELAETLGGG
jgi:glyoxylase-like metal-dependent hydrolase (beta-lactamase superfamily II)